MAPTSSNMATKFSLRCVSKRPNDFLCRSLSSLLAQTRVNPAIRPAGHFVVMGHRSGFIVWGRNLQEGNTSEFPNLPCCNVASPCSSEQRERTTGFRAVARIGSRALSPCFATPVRSSTRHRWQDSRAPPLFGWRQHFPLRPSTDEPRRTEQVAAVG